MKYSRIVRWQDLRRWLPPTAEAVASEYPAVPLGDFLERVIDQIPNASQHLPELNVIGKISFGGKLHLRSAVAKHDYKGNLFRALPGDLIFSKIRIAQGSLCVVPDELDHVAVSAEYPIYRVDPEQVSIRYLVMLLGSPPFKALLNDMAAGNTTKRRVTPANFEGLEVPLPDLDEQKSLVAAHRKARKAAAALEAEAATREHAAVTAFEAALGLTPPPDLPRRRAFISRWQDFDKWSAEGVTQVEVMRAHDAPALHYELIPLEEVADVSYGLQVSPASAPDKYPRPYLRVANVQRDRLDLSVIKYIDVPDNELSKYLLEPGDLLFVEGNGSKLELGRAALWRGEIPNCVHQNHIIRARLDQARMDPEFALEWFNTEAGRFHFLSNAKTTSGLMTLNSQDIKTAPVPVPESKELQKELVAQLRAARAGAIELRQAATKMRVAADAAFAGAIFG